MSHFKACIFDVFGTVVDWRSSVSRFSQSYFNDKGVDIEGLAFADFWRGRYAPSMAVIRAGKRGYVALDQLHFENLESTLEEFGLQNKLNTNEKWQLNTAWEQLDPWPAAAAGLTRLKQHAIIAPCSNGSIALMTRLAKYGGLPWDCILGAEIAQNYKPEPGVYLASCRALRLPENEVMMVAAHNSDLDAAREVGLQTAFIARPTEYGTQQTNDLEPSSDWEYVITDFAELSGSAQGQ